MTNLSAFIRRLFQFEGTKMHPNVLLMCKLLVMLLCIHHMFFKIQDPFIPFLPILDVFNDYPNIFKYTMRLVFILSAFALLFNIKVRTSSLIISTVVLLNIVASKPLFFNHTLICGCALFLAGLTNNQNPPYLLIYQLSLVYLGASLNKFLEVDWWTGAFMDNWLGNARANPVYLYVSQLLPDMVLAKLLSYVAMFTEFAIGVLLLFKKSRNFGVWFIIIFHMALLTLTAFRFGHFIESLVIVLLAFLNVPKGQMTIYFRKNTMTGFKKLMAFLDVDRKLLWNDVPQPKKPWLRLQTQEGTTYINHDALKHLLLYTPNFFMTLFAIDVLMIIVFYNHRTILFILNAIFIWSMILYFLPVRWYTLKTR